MDKSRDDFEHDDRHQLRWFSWSFLVSQVFGITAIVLVATWMGKFRGGFSWSSNPKTEFNYHPVLMVTGMIFLYANAIMVYRVFRNEKKKKVKLLHAGLHVTAFTFAVIALVAVFDSHNLATPPTANLYTLHSWLGLSTVILFGLQFIAGFVSFLYPGLRSHLRVSVLPIHTFLGLAIFVLAIMSALTGIMEKAIYSLQTDYQMFMAEGILANFLGITLVTFAFVVICVVVNPNFKRKPLPEEEMPLVASHEH